MTTATPGTRMASPRGQSLTDGAAVAIPGLDALTGSRSAGSKLAGLDGFWLKGFVR